MSEAAVPADNWLTVQEAAEYLGVSQPTIFRWMKQGILSFYKIGGSTRFSREVLNSVVEKTTGQKEAEAAAGTCARCGHSILVPGEMQGTSRLYFRPHQTKFWVLSEALVPLKVLACPACGFIQLNADTDKLHKLLREDQEHRLRARARETEEEREEKKEKKPEAN